MTLSERVEALSGPDRAINRDVALAVGWVRLTPSEAGRKHPAWFHPDDCRDGKVVMDSLHGTTVWREPLDYTASIDAALTLLPEGWCWCVADYKGEANPTNWGGKYQNAKGWASLTALDDEMTNIRVNANTPCLALLAAILKARGL